MTNLKKIYSDYKYLVENFKKYFSFKNIFRTYYDKNIEMGFKGFPSMK